MDDFRNPRSGQALALVLVLATVSVWSRWRCETSSVGLTLDSIQVLWCNLREDGPLTRTQVAFFMTPDGSNVQLVAPCLGSESLKLETRIPPSSVEALYRLLRTNLGRPSTRDGLTLCDLDSFGEVKDKAGHTIEFDVDKPLKGWIEAQFREELASLRAERDVRDSREMLRRFGQQGKASEWQVALANRRLEEALARSREHRWPNSEESSSR